MDTPEPARPIYELFNPREDGPNLLFLGPTRVCACGSSMFHAIVWYDPEDEESHAVAGYFTEMKCVSCGALVHGATDDPTERAAV